MIHSTLSLCPFFLAIPVVGAAVLLFALRKSRAELRRAKQAAEYTERAGQEFLSRMSHEIRTPMTAIMGMTQIALNSGESGEIRDCLHKIDKGARQLLALLNDILDKAEMNPDKPRTPSHAATKAARPDFSGFRILVAEDLEINRDIVSAFLEQTHVKLEYAANGREAVEMFLAGPARYDLILMDIQMPYMDGYQATREIRKAPMRRGQTIPIIAMTANALGRDIRESLDAGMNEHMSKPIEPEALLATLRDYLLPGEHWQEN